ncbi:MAG TPA: hypothetical protein VM146_16535 [Steroidobacteraceae bacterium]|nr:hypothetical protein [Steroidobacteraceae bacterium]
MKTLIKLAVGAAIAGAVATLFMKQRSRAVSREDEAFDDSVGIGAGDVAEPMPAEGGQKEDWYGSQAGDASRH